MIPEKPESLIKGVERVAIDLASGRPYRDRIFCNGVRRKTLSFTISWDVITLSRELSQKNCRKGRIPCFFDKLYLCGRFGSYAC